MDAMQIVKVIGYSARLTLAVAIGLALVGFLPATAQANTNPVDLELGGEGATPWVISNIKPGDSGTKIVELNNVGSDDGFVIIWVSNIISGEGANPEAETGDATGPGELNDHLLLNLSTDDLITDLNLPATINDFPHNAFGPQFIEVIPLKAGDTANLLWEWELPTQTDNEVQGDTITFTTNYLLQGFEIIELSEDVVTEEGEFKEEVIVESDTGNGELIIEEGIVGETQEGDPLNEIWLIEIDKAPSAPSEDTVTVSFHYDAGPHGTTFDEPITITITYDPLDIPTGINEKELFIALWNEAVGDWVALEGCVVDTVNSTISAPVSHFSRYTVKSPVPPPPPPPYYGGGGGAAFLPPIIEEEVPTVTTTLETDMLGDKDKVEIGVDGTLSESLTITDRIGDFIIDIDGGTKLTGPNNVILSRIELTIADESIVVPDDVVVLSPTYKLTGYMNSMEVTRMNFETPARLTIRYDPRDLPENTFLPFVAYYTVAQGLVPIEPPTGSTVEIGKAKAQISHASLFVVAAKLVPPPPPLPAEFETSNLTINPQQAQLGQPVAISLIVTNEGDTEGSFELHLIIDGIVRVVREITLTGKSSETLTFEVSNLAVGKHQVKIAGLTEQFRVEMAAAPSSEAGEVNWLAIDASVGAALVIGVLVLYFIIRRSRQGRSIVVETSSDEDDELL